MSAVDTVTSADPNVRELMEISNDLINMVGGRVEAIHLSPTSISLHVVHQEDAEFLALRLGLSNVVDFVATPTRAAFTLWWGDDGVGLLFQVFCAGPLDRPARTFANHDGLVVEGEVVGSEAA